MRKILFTLSLLVVTYALPAQDYLDSLYLVWQDESQPDSVRTMVMDDYIWDGFLYSNPDTAAILADELIAFGIKIENPKAQTTGLTTKGISYAVVGNYPKALDCFNKSLKIDEQLGDQEGIAASLANIGNIYINQGDYPRALDYHTRSLKLREQMGDQRGTVISLNNIGRIYREQGDSPKALSYCQKGYDLALIIGALNEQRDACQCL